MARRLIDVGADLIIGHHSHTIQPYEKYKGKYIFYSLGNFCFADIYHENKIYSKFSKRQKNSIILKVDFKKEDSYTVNIIQIKNRRGFIELPNKNWGLLKLYLKNVVFRIFKKNKVLWKVYFLKLKIINPIINYFFVQQGSLKEALNIEKILKHFSLKSILR